MMEGNYGNDLLAAYNRPILPLTHPGVIALLRQLTNCSHLAKWSINYL